MLSLNGRNAEKCCLIFLGKGGNNLKSTNAEVFGEGLIWANLHGFLWVFNLGSEFQDKIYLIHLHWHVKQLK